MTLVAPLATTAVQILSQRPVQGAATGGPRNQPAAITTLDLAANGKSKVAGAVFDASTPDVTQLKLDLFKRTGAALGVNEEDYASGKDYGAALSAAVVAIKSRPDAEFAILKIEKKLGLDKLGISLRTVIDAIADPSSGADNELTAALAAQMAPERTKKLSVQQDSLGLYRIA